MSDSESATLVLGLPHDFGSQMVDHSGKELMKEPIDKAIKSPNELRLRRQAEQSRDCGIENMVGLSRI